MQVISEDIKDMLEAESSLGLTFAINLFIGKEPEKPDDTVTIFDTMGFPDDLTFDATEIYERPSIQIRVRSNDYMTGMTLAQDIKASLHGRGNETWNGTLYTVIRSVGGPALMDWDGSDRARFIINFNLQRR
jgi:hypothetical protein